MSQITRAERIQAFLFLLVGLVVTASVVLTLVGLRFAESPRTFYLRFSETVSGLSPGAPVRYKGVKYGKVAKIGVDEDDPEIIEVSLQVDPDAPIRVSTTAVIATESILGPYHIELRGSRAGSPHLPAGSYIPASATTLAKLLATGETLGDQLAQVLENVGRWTDEPHRLQFWRTVEEIETTLRSVREAVEEIRPEVVRFAKEGADLTNSTKLFFDRIAPVAETLITALSESANRVNEILQSGTVEQTAEAVRAALTRATGDLAATSDALRKWLKDNQVTPHLDRAVASLERVEAKLTSELDGLSAQGRDVLRTGVTPALEELHRTSIALTRLLELLERQPRALIFGSSPERKPLPGGRKQ